MTDSPTDGSVGGGGPSRFADRVRDLLADAAEHAARAEWDAVRNLAEAALTLDPGSGEAQDLLGEADAADPAPGERRQLTLMFCDIVGSTAMSAERDPEVVREVTRRYQTACDTTVRRYGGHIAAYSGDGILVYFGHPIAHEDDARRAVRAGLDLLEALQPVIEEARQRHDIELSIRAAVHTGLVVRADMGSPSSPDRNAIVGAAPNLAARLQDHAPPGRLVISGATHELVRGWFLVAPMGDLQLKGIPQPVPTYEVLEETPGTSRIEVQADLSPFVGRQAEVETLVGAWEHVQEGGSATVLITGEAGVGKTRMADLIHRRVQESDHTAVVAHCSSYRTSSALHPIRRMIERAAGIDARAPQRHPVQRLWGTLDQVGLGEALPLVIELLGLPNEPWSAPHELDGPRLREELLTALVGWVQGLAEQGPTLVVLDDAQWADPTTIELTSRVIGARIPGLLLVITARDDFAAPWSSVRHVPLQRLSLEELTELAGGLPEGRSLPSATVAELARRSDGLPLFLEELLHASAAADARGDRQASIPPSLRDLLLARVTAPGADLRLAQVVATIGVGASMPLLEAVIDLPAEELERQLALLVGASILTHATADEPYRFRHHLLAELAYDTQLAEPRRQVHSRVADVLSADPSTDLALVAHHLERAERWGEAARSLTGAAEAAQALGASSEAGDLLDRALSMLDRIAADQRADVEFAARMRRGMNVAVTLGYAAPQVVADLTRAAELVPELSQGDPGHERDGDGLWSVFGLWSAFLVQGRLAECRALTRDTLAHLDPDSALAVYLGACTSFITFFEGDWAVAERQLLDAIEVMQTVKVPEILPLPNHPLPVALGHLAMVTGVRGDLEAARGHLEDALDLAAKLPFPRGPFSYCYVAGIGSGTEFRVGDQDTARRHATEQTEVAERHGYLLWQLTGQLQTAMADASAAVPGSHQMAANLIAVLRATGVVVWLPGWMASLAQAHLDRGELDEADAHLSAAAELTDQTGARFWSAEVMRLQGEVVAARTPSDPRAVELLRAAVGVAAAQGATVFELRARAALCARTADPADREALAELLARSHASPLIPDVAVAESVLAGGRT
jgi:class 3 adenylate cyclase/tetratricopeptide (TPR) repeat protein